MIDKGFKVDIISLKKTKIDNIHEKLNKYGLLDSTKTLKKFSLLTFLVNILLFPKNCFKILSIRLSKLSGLVVSNYQLLNSISNYDIVHAHYGHVGAFLSELKFLGVLSTGPKLVVSFHGNDIVPGKFEFYKFKYSKLVKDFSVLVANSIYTKDLLINCFPDSLTSVKILPASIDLSFLEHSQIKQSKKTITFLFCGRFIELKNPIFVLEIFKKLIELGFDIDLIMVGEGEELSKCKEFVIDNSLHNKVRFTGYLPQEGLIDVFLASDIFLFPGKIGPFGYAETQGLVIQEAQAMRLPVLISEVGGMKYGMINKKSGFIIKENDLDGFVDKAKMLLNDPNLRLEMGNNGYRFVKEYFSSHYLGSKLIKEIYTT